MKPNKTLIALSFVAATALADATDYGAGIENFAPSRLLENSDGQYDRWQGIGRLESRGNRLCTAVLIDTRESDSAANGPAYVLSNGHCVYNTLGRIGVDLHIEGHVEFNYFKDTPSQRKVYSLKRLNWSSLQGTDLAVLELDAPLSELIEDGIQPLRLADGLPEANSPILSVSAPVAATGYTLRLSACTLESVAQIVEHPYAWVNNLRNRCQDVLPGSSGSPILNRVTHEVIGIMGTSTTGSSENSRCFADAPCEVNDGQPTWLNTTNYGSPTYPLNACFVAGHFAPSAKDCTLLPTFSVTLHNPNYLQHYFPIGRDAQDKPIAARWNLRFSVDTSHFYFKTVRDPLACRDPHRYSASTHAQNAFIDAPIGTEPGLYLLCIIGVDAMEQKVTPGLLNNAFILTAELVDDLPPLAPNFSITPVGNKQHVAFNQAMPLNAGHAYKFGAPDSTDCDDPKGYKIVGYNFNIGQRLLPVKLCTYAMDAAGRMSAPRTDLVERPEA
jgi:Trypsin-like peptidase domain